MMGADAVNLVSVGCVTAMGTYPDWECDQVLQREACKAHCYKRNKKNIKSLRTENEDLMAMIMHLRKENMELKSKLLDSQYLTCRHPQQLYR